MLKDDIKAFFSMAWVLIVRGTPYSLVVWGIALALDFILFPGRWAIASFDSLALVLNLWSWDYRRRHGTLPANGWDDDL